MKLMVKPLTLSIHSIQTNHLTVNYTAQWVKNLPAVQETWVQILGWEDPLEKEMATHSSILAWRIHGQRSLAGYSPWVHKHLDTTERPALSRHFHIMNTT